MTVCVTCCGYVTLTRRGTQQTQRAGVNNQNKDKSTRFFALFHFVFMMMISMMLVGSRENYDYRAACVFVLRHVTWYRNRPITFDLPLTGPSSAQFDYTAAEWLLKFKSVGGDTYLAAYFDLSRQLAPRSGRLRFQRTDSLPDDLNNLRLVGMVADLPPSCIGSML